MDEKNEIKTTMDYSLFTFLKVNRDIDLSNLDKLIQSIKRKNFCKDYPILVNSQLEILDGQHRFKACKALNLPIHYKIRTDFEMDDIILLNNASKNWAIKNYLHFYTGMNYPEYIYLNELIKKTGFQIGDLLIIAKGDTGANYKAFRTGIYSVKNKIQYENMVGNLVEIKRICPEFFRNKYNLRAYNHVFASDLDGKNQAIFISKLIKHPQKTYATYNKRISQELIEDIYNFNQKNRVRLF